MANHKTRRRKKRVSHNKTRATFVKHDHNGKQRCSPSQKGNDFSCYSNDDLKKLREKWNARHPSAAIASEDPKHIWTALKNNMSTVCRKESCWLKQGFLSDRESSVLLNESFAPEAPEEWKKNPNEWLSSIDIIKVMKQYEKAFKCFEFMGPSPIDFNTHLSYGECVWEELCEFSLKEQLMSGKTKIGVIFNLDNHDQPGSHWVSLFIDIKKLQIMYFDSAGEKIPVKIKQFVNKVMKQGRQMSPPIPLKFDQNYPIEHQYGNTECGIYSIYFIVHMLKDRTNAQYLKNHILPDKFMENFRKIYFNETL